MQVGSGEETLLKIHKDIDDYFFYDVPHGFFWIIEALQNKLRNNLILIFGRVFESLAQIAYWLFGK